MINKILLYNYALTFFLSRGQKQTLYRGTWFFLGTELFFFSLSLLEFLLPKFDFKFNNISLLVILVILGFITQYGIENWVYRNLKELKIEEQYHKGNKVKNILVGLLLFVLSFALVFISGIMNFAGYINR